MSWAMTFAFKLACFGTGSGISWWAFVAPFTLVCRLLGNPEMFCWFTSHWCAKWPQTSWLNIDTHAQRLRVVPLSFTLLCKGLVNPVMICWCATRQQCHGPIAELSICICVPSRLRKLRISCRYTRNQQMPGQWNALCFTLVCWQRLRNSMIVLTYKSSAMIVKQLLRIFSSHTTHATKLMCCVTYACVYDSENNRVCTDIVWQLCVAPCESRTNNWLWLRTHFKSDCNDSITATGTYIITTTISTTATITSGTAPTGIILTTAFVSYY